MRFLADMGTSPHTVSFLGKLGHEAVHLHTQGLDRAEDSAILSNAREENRVLLTHDRDFGELIAASGARLPSIIVFRLRDMRPGTVNPYLESIVNQHRELLDQRAIVSVTEGRVRVRLLPIESAPFLSRFQAGEEWRILLPRFNKDPIPSV